jgi:hypothetical protein
LFKEMPAAAGFHTPFDRSGAPAVRRSGSSLQGFRRAVRLISDLTISMEADTER